MVVMFQRIARFGIPNHNSRNSGCFVIAVVNFVNLYRRADPLLFPPKKVLGSSRASEAAEGLGGWRQRDSMHGDEVACLVGKLLSPLSFFVAFYPSQ